MTKVSSKNKAYRLHVAPGRQDRLNEALNENIIMIGWSKAEGLLDCSISDQRRRNIIHDSHYPLEENQIKAGNAAGCMKRFICEMDIDDYVLVTFRKGIKLFYIAKVIHFDNNDKLANYIGDNKLRHYYDKVDGVRYYFDKVDEGTAYRRKVKWAHIKSGLPQKLHHSELKKDLRKKFYTETTILDISEYIDEIEGVIKKYNLIFD